MRTSGIAGGSRTTGTTTWSWRGRSRSTSAFRTSRSSRTGRCRSSPRCRRCASPARSSPRRTASWRPRTQSGGTASRLFSWTWMRRAGTSTRGESRRRSPRGRRQSCRCTSTALPATQGASRRLRTPTG